MALQRIVTEIPSDRLSSIFGRESVNPHVLIAHGYGVTIRVRYSQLEIADGIGRARRTVTVTNTDRDIRRLFVTSANGYVTFDALKWCSEHNISVTMIDSSGDIVSSHIPYDDDSPKHNLILRSQINAAGTPLGLEIARELLARKLAGQESNVILFTGDKTASQRISSYRSELEYVQTIPLIMGYEANAAKEYFGAWRGAIAMQFDDQSAERIPDDWKYFPGRASYLTGHRKLNHASDPINAMLNYAYALAANECRIAAIAASLDPRFSFTHDDQLGRDSLAYDMLETVRPEIDRYIVDLIRSRVFSYRDFTDKTMGNLPPGTVRVSAPLAHEIAEHSYSWHKSASETATLIIRMLTGGNYGGRKHNNAMQDRDRFVSQIVTIDEILPEKLWPEISALIPARTLSKFRTPIDDRIIIAGMIFMTQHKRPWAQLPASFGVAPATLNHRRRAWHRTGHWDSIHSKIRELASR